MPFMIGPSPIRRTLQYLKSCKIYFRDNVRIFSLSYAKDKNHHLGASEFAFWHLGQIQYNNPEVQCIELQNLTATPFIKIYCEDEEPVLIDLDSRTRKEIYDHLKNLTLVTKTEEEVKMKSRDINQAKWPTYFGYGCQRHCLCEIYGQVPCPGVVPVPKHWRGLSNKGPNKLHIPPHIRKWGLEKNNNE